MKLILPVFNSKTQNQIKFDIFSGASIFNPSHLKVGLPEAELIIKGWDGFEVLTEKRISFNAKANLIFYTDQIFSKDELQNITVVTVEFDSKILPPEMIQAKYGLYEVKSLLRTPKMVSGVLYDMIGDKKTGHKYAPIIHPFHTGLVRTEGSQFTWDTYCLFVNYRPTEGKPASGSLHKPFEDLNSQKMWMGLKKSDGNMVAEKILDLKYNSTYLISLGESFKEFGGYQNGDQLVLKGGASQFAIFSLFVNHEHQSIGMEHSLPPVYYSSGLFKPKQRGQFYSKAFARFSKGELS